jgi:hypothetical protein
MERKVLLSPKANYQRYRTIERKDIYGVLIPYGNVFDYILIASRIQQKGKTAF